MIDGLAVSWSLDHLLGLLGPDGQSPSCLEQGWSGNHRLWPKTNLVTRIYELTGGADKQTQEKHWRAALTTALRDHRHRRWWRLSLSTEEPSRASAENTFRTCQDGTSSGESITGLQDVSAHAALFSWL